LGTVVRTDRQIDCGSVRTILEAVGEDPDRPGLVETPRRVANMYAEMFSGLHLEPERHLEVVFPEEYDEMVLVRDISFTSMCEHHVRTSLVAVYRCGSRRVRP